MRKAALLVLIILIPLDYAAAQTAKSSVLLQKDLKFSYWDYIKYMNQEHNNLFNGLHYNKTWFDNAPLLKSYWETKFSLGGTIYPLIYEANIVKGNMSVKGVPLYSSEDYSISLQRISFYASICPPILYYAEKALSINLMSDNIIPFVGIGWQGTELKLKSSTNDISYNSATWKIGCHYYFQNLPIIGVIEYENSFNGAKQKEFQSISIGIVVEWQVLKSLLDINHRYIPRNL